MMPGFSDDDGKMLVADTLRLFVGHGRRLSWADLATATGDDCRKLRSYVEADPPAMPAPVFMRVFAVLPPEAFARVARHMGFTSAPMNVDDDATVRRGLAQAARLVADGTVYGGMLAKNAGGIDAAKAGVHAVHIVDGRVPHAMLLEILTDQAYGTMICNQ